MLTAKYIYQLGVESTLRTRFLTKHYLKLLPWWNVHSLIRFHLVRMLPYKRYVSFGKAHYML